MHGTSVHFYQFFADAKTQTCACELTGEGFFSLFEFLEDGFPLIFGYADAGVGNLEFKQIILLAGADCHESFLCEFDGITDQVEVVSLNDDDLPHLEVIIRCPAGSVSLSSA